MSPMCDCVAETETTSHFFIDASIKNLNEDSLIDILSYGSDRYNDSKNKQIFLVTICYIQSTKSF